MTFYRLRDGHYLASGKYGSGYEITKNGVWCLYRLENIENQQSAGKIGEFGHLNEAKAFAREYNAAQPDDFGEGEKAQ